MGHDGSHPLLTPVQFVRGVGPHHAATLGKLGILTVGDLLTHYPNRYEDRREFRPLRAAQEGSSVLARVRVVEASVERTSRRGMSLVRVLVADGSAPGELVFFQQPWLRDRFARMRGREICVFGRVERRFGQVVFQNPEWEELGGADDTLHVGRIVPIHGATEGITPKQIRRMVWEALEAYARHCVDLVPPETARRRRLAELVRSVHEIHFPHDEASLEAARRRLVFDELFLLQCALAMRKHQTETTLPGIPFLPRPEALEELRRSLPFAFTAAQERAIREILDDMALPRPMHRLLQGDVGSGKTVVAAAAILNAVRNGYQVALMVPTEILAEQHYSVLREILEPLGLVVHRLVGSVRAKGKRLIKDQLRSGECQVVVGTHTLIAGSSRVVEGERVPDDVEFRRLGLVIIDEQHRFGVVQRLTLLDKGMVEHVPDLLVLTATPIPRTLALTVYGDLDVSLLDELPPGRKPVKTHWKRKEQREAVYGGVRKLVRAGRQVYYVCPLVEASPKLEAKAANEVFEHLRTEVFPDLRVGLLHGQMPSHEKDAAMDAFRAGEYDVLVATVVIEVGVDVPNACCMVIEDAERFGLAQLHQLRGRVGRGEGQSFCVLLADPKTPDGEQRLRIMIETTDGFRIAEEDLRIRGPGEFHGTRQSGLMRLRIANIVGDRELLEEAREEAFRLIEQDPDLSLPEHEPLGEHLRRNYGELVLAATG